MATTNNEYKSNQHKLATEVQSEMHAMLCSASTAASGLLHNDTMLSCTAGAKSKGLFYKRDGRSSSSSSRARQAHQP
jgi:hypothetical protein